jgi:hypothetical protein
MGRKRPERTERRARERQARQLVRDREKLARLSAGGSQERPIEVGSVAVIEGRARAMPCPQCEGTYRIVDHRAPRSGLRVLDVTCQQCHVSRELWFRLVAEEPN